MKWSRLSVAVLMLIQAQGFSAHAGPVYIDLGKGILPIETTPKKASLIDLLAPVDNTGKKVTALEGGTTPVVTPTPAVIVPKGPTVAAAFKCNLFESSDLTDILSSVTALNTAMNSPSCKGNGVNAQGINDNNKKLVDAIKNIQALYEAPAGAEASDKTGLGKILEATTKSNETSTIVVSNVDVAIQAASALATAFADSDLLSDECRAQMNTGDVALALNNIINGLTPFALMAASATGMTAAVPFIVGGSIATNMISSIDKILTSKEIKIKDASVRRAIVENTCQFIRIDQKYKFLIKSREEQTQKISKEMKKMQTAFSSQLGGFSKATNTLVTRQAQLNQISLALESNLSRAQGEMASSRQFITGTSDELKVCQLGLQLASMREDSNSYLMSMLSSLDTAMTASGNERNPQAGALKFSADIAFRSLNAMMGQQFTIDSNFSSCAKATKSLIETAEQAAALSKRMVKLALTNVDKDMRNSADYDKVQAQLTNLNQNQALAATVVGSLDNLREYANNFTQSEIAAEMDRLRANLSKPVMAWFKHTQGFYNASLQKYNEGVMAVRQRALALNTGFGFSLPKGPAVKDPYHLNNFTLKNMPKGSRGHIDACREMQEVWDRWIKTVDHVSAMETFCGMIEPYIYDQRPEDRAMVIMCRGRAPTPQVPGYESTIETFKTQLVENHAVAWSQTIKSKMNELQCPQPVMQ